MPKLIDTQITLRLNEDLYETLRSQEKVRVEGMAWYLSKFVNEIITQHFGGALLLTPDHVQRIEQVSNQQVSSADDVVRIVQRGNNRDDGQFTIRAQIDPAFETPLRDQAAMMGWTVEDLLHEVVNTVLVNSWMYSFVPQGGNIALTTEQAETIRSLTGKKSFSADDIIAALSAQRKAA